MSFFIILLQFPFLFCPVFLKNLQLCFGHPILIIELVLFKMVKTYALHGAPLLKQFFDLVREGDVQGVQELKVNAFLHSTAGANGRHNIKLTRISLDQQENENLDINTIDHKGQFALQLAVKNQNVEMVRFLLSEPDVMLGDALLHAINEGHVGITEMLLTWKQRYRFMPCFIVRFELWFILQGCNSTSAVIREGHISLVLQFEINRRG